MFLFVTLWLLFENAEIISENLTGALFEVSLTDCNRHSAISKIWFVIFLSLENVQ